MTKTENLLHPKNLDYLFACFDVSRLDEGVLIWKERPRHHFKDATAWKAFNTRLAGKEAGARLRGHSYATLAIKDPETKATVYVNKHRLIWLLKHCETPPPIIDHRNRLTFDNRPSNLRAVTEEQNRANSISHSGCMCSGTVTQTERGTYQMYFESLGADPWQLEFDSKIVALSILNYLSYLYDTREEI